MALGDVDQAIEAHTKAAALVEKKHLTDPESLGILGMYALDTCQFEKAATVYKRFRQQYPENPFPYFYEADAVRRLGQPEYSNSLIRQAIRLGPGYFGFRNGLCLNLLKDGSLDTAAEENERSRSLAASGWADRMAAAIAFSRLRMADVEAALKSMERKPEAEFQSMALQLTACLRADQGRLTEAETLLRRGRDFAISENLPQSHVFDFESLLVEVLRLTKRLPDAVALCRKMLARSTGMQETMRTGCLLARCGAVAEAAGCSVAAPDLPVYGHWACRLRGEIALARGDAANGLMWMSRTPEYAIPIWPEYLVRAALAAGQTQIAADQVNRLAANPGPYWFQANHAPPGFIRWAAELARSERLAGVNTGAIARLYEFLT
jgi:tetratricopeptide (TPR) repeat protein